MLISSFFLSVKVFDLNAGNIRQQQQHTCDFEFNEDQQLITSLESLKVRV